MHYLPIIVFIVSAPTSLDNRRLPDSRMTLPRFISNNGWTIVQSFVPLLNAGR